MDFRIPGLPHSVVKQAESSRVRELVKKKGRHHGHRYGKCSSENKEYYLAHNLKKRCSKREFAGIHDRFLRDPEFRASQLEHDRDEDVGTVNGDGSCRRKMHTSMPECH